MRRKAFLGSLAFLLAVAGGAAWAADVATLRLELRIESALLDDDLASYEKARDREEQALRRAAGLAARIDDQLTADSPDLAQIEDLGAALDLARESAHQAGERAQQLRQSVFDHHRRIRLLTEAIESGRTATARRDPVSGRWQVRILPLNQRGVFALDLEGTLVHGSYQLDGGYHGSLRGTYVGRTLRLERIDSERGFDIVFEADLDASSQRLDGSWQATLLSNSGPGGGTWTATKIEPPAEPTE